MAIWQDPLVPRIHIPPELSSKETNNIWYRLGSARYQLLPKQYEFITAKEEFISFMSGYGGGKTRIGAIRSALHSMAPNNRGLVGRLAGTDLEETTQRDLLDFLRDAELLKEAPNAKNHRALVYCIDLKTGKNLGYTSEISFQHLDDPDHLRGRHLGWVWIDEGSEVHKKAWQNLIGRLRLPEYKGRYTAFVTGNPEGHNWIYDFFFNQDSLSKITCGGKPGSHVPGQCIDFDDIKCNARIRQKRRAIHCTSFENYFLPAETLEIQVSSFSEEDRMRYLEASFDVFEGQIFKEFNQRVHVIQAPDNWEYGVPPKEWPRLMACDVGGATPWALEWIAVDPENNIVFYDEVYEATTNVDDIASKALPKMFHGEHSPYTFKAKVIDYENKIAAEDMKRRGITFTNAQKHAKASSIHRLASYLHPNPKHHFPDWHPMAGQPNAPRLFIVGARCPNLVRELPQQRWKEDSMNGMKNEPDRSVENHATDCSLYLARELPEISRLKPSPGKATVSKSMFSALYWADVHKRQQEMRQSTSTARPYRIRPIDIDTIN